MEDTSNSPLQRVAFIGGYLPRQCGIATFMTDLCEALAAQFQAINVLAIPVNDTVNGYSYPPRVRFELLEQDLASYRRAADYLNINNIDLVCLQHEYGIIGGTAGSHILALLRDLRMPIVTTLHTVLHDPDAGQRKALEELAHLSDRLVVMSQRSVDFLQEVYHVPGEKIDFIPHGIPDVAFVDPNFYKDQFGVEGKHVLLTFGLLSSNKGIEQVIAALPKILEVDPNVVYIVLGATHPQVKRREGEAYRISLQQLARERGVEKNVIFHNRFVTLEELVEFIGAADIYLTPYQNPAQIVSGTLAYTVGAGKAVVSTPYWYAQELLADDRGLIVPFKDSAALAQAVIDLLSNETERHAKRKRAYLLGREMIWSKVAEQYLATFERAREDRRHTPRPSFTAPALDRHRRELPALKLDHVRRMTDSTGILQHARFSVPYYAEGYTTDDNARALSMAVLLEELGQELVEQAYDLASRYLAFLNHAYNPDNGRFRNFMSYDRHWLEEAGSEDSHARALRGLSVVVERSQHDGLRNLAGQLFERALPAALEFSSPRSWAFTLIAINSYLQRFSGDSVVQNAREVLAGRLMELYRCHSSPAWLWFEDSLTYSNARLPQAILLTGQALNRHDMIETGLQSLEWLIGIQQPDGDHLVPIGCDGFYRRGGERARFDQQPIEACATVSACLTAQRITHDDRWHQPASIAFEWFLGRNDLRQPIVDVATGGCRDSLQPDGLNLNQGAESTLAYLHALLEMRLAENVIQSTT